uniref:Rx N-terminal domain-containing protein n=1 Tax=Setaria italica TaxID=4555 RepID=K3ZCT9_SETIT
MEAALSAFLGEIANRSVSFFIENLFKENLHCKLLRVCNIIEEAEGRQIRNQAMLDQLKVLQGVMYRGYYVLDAFKYRAY